MLYKKLYKKQFQIAEDVKENYRTLKEQYDSRFDLQ